MLTPLHILETSHEHHHTFFLYGFHRTALPLVSASVHYLHCRRSTLLEAYCCWVGTLLPCVASITYIPLEPEGFPFLHYMHYLLYTGRGYSYRINYYNLYNLHYLLNITKFKDYKARDYNETKLIFFKCVPCTVKAQQCSIYGFTWQAGGQKGKVIILKEKKTSNIT